LPPFDDDEEDEEEDDDDVVILCFHSALFICGFVSTTIDSLSSPTFLFLKAPSKLCDGGIICILGFLDFREMEADEVVVEEAEEEEEEEEEGTGDSRSDTSTTS